MVKMNTANIVAYSGGVDSSLVAALVQRTFSDGDGFDSSSFVRDGDNNNGLSKSGSVLAILGISPAVPKSQILMARRVADKIGIPLREVETSEGADETYMANDGHACYVCKTHLYSTLKMVAKSAHEQIGVAGAEEDLQRNVLMFNGTNLEDTKDPTRLGLLAASEFEVHSPLDCVTKDQVRQAARHLGLPNWNSAASPCLRSRLAMNVLATEGHLRAVEHAEVFVRRILDLDETVNARVRMLPGELAMVELDAAVLGVLGKDVARDLELHGFEQKCIEWGFKSFGGVRSFRTGSVAAMRKIETPRRDKVAVAHS